jgi:uncharacterized membrane-anchored protein
VANLGELLQTRVQVEMEVEAEEQNSAILRSFNSRTNTQIKLQKAMEGLSPQLAALLLGPLALLIIGAIALRIRKARRH